MWSSDRRAVIRAAALATAALGVAACGFEPMYGTGTTARAGLGQIYVEPIDSAAGYELRDWLIMGTRAGKPADPSPGDRPRNRNRRCGADNHERDNPLQCDRRGGFPARLADKQRDRAGGNVEGISGYSAPESETASAYATRVARADAIRRVSRQLAERIALRLSIESPKWAETTPGIAEDGSGA